jgi:Leucine-rich repeat (LRR) protein
MKTRLLFLIPVFLLSFVCKAQIINIPDANFKAKLLSSSSSNTVARDINGNYAAIDINGNGEIEVSEASEVSELNISNSNISSLDGISNFSLFYFDCSYNQITSLDISSMTNLYYLDCSHNSLTVLDLTASSSIININCSYNSLTSLQLNNSYNQTESLDCSHNSLTGLDLTASPYTVNINCSYNSLTNLQLSSSSTQMENLDCSHNQLTSLVSPTVSYGIPNPLNINCSYNLLTSFSLLDNVAYGTINCSNNQMISLAIKNKNVASLDCSNNPLSELSFQDIKLQTLSYLNVNNTNITSICKNEGDILPATGSVPQTVCNGAVLGMDPGLKKLLISTNASVCNSPGFNIDYWGARDSNQNCINLDSDEDGELLQTDLNQVAYINFHYDPISSYNPNFGTTSGISHLVNLKGIEGIIGGTSSYQVAYLGHIDIDGLQNLEYINLAKFYAASLKIKNTPKLTSVFTGGYHNNGFGNTSLYEFENCPLLETVKGIDSSIQTLTFQNCPNVKEIDVTGNRLSAFDASSLNNLETLHLGNFLNYGSNDMVDRAKNTLTSLNLSNKSKLTTLTCKKGVLSSLDISNCPLLEMVNCSDNNLTSLNLSNTVMPYLPAVYNFNSNSDGVNLSCSNNQLSTVSMESAQIAKADFSNNQLNTLFLKNGYTEEVTFNNNPNISYICADDSQLSAVQTLINQYGYNTTCNLNTYCSFVPGGNYNTITGTVRFDENNNGCDTNDEIFEHMKLKISDGTNTGETFVKNNGKYDFYTQAGNFTVTAEPENPSLFTVTPASFTTSFPDNNNHIFNQDICVVKNGNANDLEVVIAPVTNAVPGFDATYKLMWRNKGNTTISGSAVLTFDASKMSFVSSSLPSTISGNQITFNFSNLKPYANTASEIVFNINTPTHSTNPVNSGDQLIFSANVNPLAGDINPQDNAFTYKQTVVNSLDPNDITCIEGSTIPTAMIGSNLHYIVNFENTGTSNAVNIVVEMDIDPADFDISTLQLQNASHLAYTRLKDNKVEFIMKLANLGSGGHGNILMKVKSKNTLAPGDQVINKANIYFDYNFPIVTNNATTSIESTLKAAETSKDGSVKLYPNPTKGDVTIDADSKIQSVEVYDAQGRIIQKQIGINSQNTKVSIHSSNQGMYYFKVITDKGVLLKKVIKN